MYLFKGSQVSFRVSTELNQQLNDLLTQLQTNGNHTFKSMKEFMEYLIPAFSAFSNPEIIENEIETDADIQTVTDETIENVAEIDEINVITGEFKLKVIEAIGYEDIPTDEILFSDLLEIITTPLEPAPVVEVEKEVIVEVERKLLENEVLLDLLPKQYELLRKIARWRSSTKRDEKTNDLPTLIKRMIFNHGTLTNDHGAFATGITPRKLK